MEGRFESFTLGREISIDRVKEIYGLFKKHEFRLAGLRSLGRYLSEDELGAKRELAEQLRDDPELLERTKRVAAQKLAKIPIRSKGVAQVSGDIPDCRNAAPKSANVPDSLSVSL